MRERTGQVQAEIQVRVPDIGDFEDVEVIEVLVAKGDRVDPEDSLVTLESEKATMEIPSPEAGRIADVHVRLGDRVSEGSLLLVLEPTAAQAEPDRTAAEDDLRPVASEYRWASRVKFCTAAFV